MEAVTEQELMNLATSHYNAGNYEAALETYQKALTIDYRNLRARHGLARSLASLHKCREALEEFGWVLNCDGLSNDWYSELYKQRGDVYFELQISGSLRGKFWFYTAVLQNFLHALDDYDRALTLNRKNEEAESMKAQATDYYLQQRDQLGDDADQSEMDFYDARFGYSAYKKAREASLLERTNRVIAFSKTKEQWLQEGINHYLAEDYTNSLRACELAIILDANYARAYYGKGLTLRRCDNNQEALLAFERAIELDPTYFKALYGKGKALCEKRRYEEALTVYEQAIKLNPKYALAYSGKGTSLFALQRNEEAFAAFDKAIELDPNCFDPYHQKGSKLLELKREKEAFEVFDQAILSHPYDFSVYESIALEVEYFVGYGEQVLVIWEKALANYDQAISLNLNSAAAYVRKGDIFQMYPERNEDAVAAYDQAALLDPDFTINKASYLYKIARYEEAANAYSQIIKYHPNDPVAHYMKGEANLFTGRNEEALASFEQVLQLDPNDVIAHYNKGKALFGCGRYEEALTTFKKTISIFEDTSTRYKLYNSFHGINSKYDISRSSGSKSWSLDDIYAEIYKKYAGLEDFQNALTDLEQYYEDICKKIDKKIAEEIQAMFGWMKNDDVDYCDEDEYYEQLEYTSDDEEEDEDVEDEYQDYKDYYEIARSLFEQH